MRTCQAAHSLTPVQLSQPWLTVRKKHMATLQEKWNEVASIEVVEQRIALYLQKEKIPVGRFKHIYFW